MGQLGIDFVSRIAFAKEITGVDTGASTFTFADEEHVVGNFLSDGDTLEVTGSTGNDGTYTIATSGVDTGTDDETTVTVDEAVSDATADGTIKYVKAIGGATNATWNESTSLAEVTNKDSGRHTEQLPTTREVSLDFEAGFLESGQQVGQGMTVEVSTDGGSNWESVEELTSISLSLSMALEDDTDNDSNRWRELLPSTRSASISLDGQYKRPDEHAALDDIRTQVASGSSIDVKITLSSFIYEATFFAASESYQQPLDTATNSISLEQSDTEPSITYTAQDDGLRVFLAAFYGDPSPPVEVQEQVVDEGGNLISGATYREGNFYPESLTIDLPFDDEATVSGTLQNTGAITTSTQ